MKSTKFKKGQKVKLSKDTLTFYKESIFDCCINPRTNKIEEKEQVTASLMRLVGEGLPYTAKIVSNINGNNCFLVEIKVGKFKDRAYYEPNDLVRVR